MRISSFVWDEENEEHISRHGVEPEEAEEVFAGNPLIYKAKYDRYYALGPTEDGSLLTIVFEYLGQGEARVIMARSMSSAEQKLYRRKKRK